MSNKSKTVTTGVSCSLLLAIMLLMLVSACTPAAPSKPTADRQLVKVGAAIPLSGPYSVGAAENQFGGFEDYLRWLEEEQGGITAGGKKYKLECLYGDSKAEIPLCTAIFKRHVADGAVLIYVTSGHEGAAMYSVSEQLKVANVGTGFGKPWLEKPGWTFGVGTGYPECNTAGIKWYKENVWKKTGKMKVGLLYWDIAMGKGVDIPEVNDTLTQDIGCELLPVEYFPMAVSDFTPNLIRLRDQKPDLYFFQSLGAQFAMCLRDAARLGIKSDQFMCTQWGFLENSFLKVASPELAEGSRGLWLFNMFPQEDNDRFPEIKRMCDAMQKYRGSRTFYDQNYTKGWAVGKIMDKAVTIALEKYGYPITGQQVYDSLQTIDKWDWGLSSGLTYSKGERLGWHAIRVLQAKQGKFEILSDWLPAPEGLKKRAPWIWGQQ